MNMDPKVLLSSLLASPNDRLWTPMALKLPNLRRLMARLPGRCLRSLPGRRCPLLRFQADAGV